MAESELEVNEGEGVARVCATMLGSADFSIYAVFTMTADSAFSPDDYNPSQREVLFPARNNSRRCAEIPIVDDSVLEYREAFNVTLSISNPHHERVKLGPSSTAVVSIVDNDCKLNGLPSKL